MASSLEKAKQNPDSMKAKILSAARKIFGENTASVLNEFGYSADKIKELEAQGII